MPIGKKFDQPREIAVLLFEAFSNHCLANAIEPFRASNTLSGRELYKWRYISLDGLPVRSSSGLSVQPEVPLDLHDGGAYLFVLPSYGFRNFTHRAALRMLRTAARRFDCVAGMDAGAWLLAAAGLLSERRATIHWDEIQEFEETFPDVDVVNRPFVIDGPFATCGGVTTTFDLALNLIERDHGSMLRLEVAAFFVHSMRDRGAYQTLGESDDATILAAVDLMRRRIEEAPTVAEIATALQMSRRALETLFRDQLDRTPREVMKTVRLREARRLAEQTRISVAEIAARCGYSDSTALTRAVTSRYGLSPRALRQAARAKD